MYSQTNLCFSRTQKLAETFFCTASVLQKSNFLFQIRTNFFFLSALANLTALEPRVKIFYKRTSILSITLSTDPSTKNKFFSVKKRAKLAKKMNRESKRKSTTFFVFFSSRQTRRPNSAQTTPLTNRIDRCTHHHFTNTPQRLATFFTCSK